MSDFAHIFGSQYNLVPQNDDTVVASIAALESTNSLMYMLAQDSTDTALSTLVPVLTKMLTGDVSQLAYQATKSSRVNLAVAQLYAEVSTATCTSIASLPDVMSASRRNAASYQAERVLMDSVHGVALNVLLYGENAIDEIGKGVDEAESTLLSTISYAMNLRDIGTTIGDAGTNLLGVSAREALSIRADKLVSDTARWEQERAMAEAKSASASTTGAVLGALFQWGTNKLENFYDKRNAQSNNKAGG